jgi:hypothetical protein
MNEHERTRPQDEEVAEPTAQAGIRGDTGSRGAPNSEGAADRPTEQATDRAPAAARAEGDTPTGGPEKGPRGSGEEPGYGHLGTSTPGSVGAPEGSADRSRGS